MNTSQITNTLAHTLLTAILVATIGCSALSKSKSDVHKLDPREVARIAAADPFPNADEPPRTTR
ncbi:MAG: hypothetical protein ACRC46_03080 [Thermoguttaceae bacterium]